MDRTAPSEGADAGSIPAESTHKRKTPQGAFFFWLGLRFLESGREARLLAVCRIALDNPRLAGLINGLVGRREELLCSLHIIGGKRLRELLSGIAESVLAAQIKNMLTRRGADRFLR